MPSRSPAPVAALLPAVAVVVAVAAAVLAAPVAAADEPPPAGRFRTLLIDGNAPFFDPEKPPIRSWAMPFAHMDLPGAPWVDEAHMLRSVERFERYCDRVAGMGYTGVTLGNLIHLATFDGVPEGRGAVYGPTSPYRLRAERYRAHFRRLIAAAHARGLEVVIETDFPAYTPDLLAYLGPDGLSNLNPRLWAAHRAAVRELLVDLDADALSVRIGEGGGAYDEVGTGYASTVTVTTVADARRLVAETLDAVEDAGLRAGEPRRLYFRTWTIGIGELGRLHTSPALYERVFRPFYGRRTLVCVMKHVATDFFDHAPANPTIGRGDVAQVVEFQARREFEGFGLFPNFRGASFREDLERMRACPQVEGVSVWAANGGFLLRAPVFYGCHGPDDWIDANVYAYARLVREPDLAPEDAARDWAARRMGLSSDDAERVARVLARSPEAVRTGLYVGAFARNAPPLFGVDVMPPMMWFWWTRPIGAHGVQALVYRAVRAAPDAAIAEGEAAVAAVDAMLADAEGLSPSPFRDRLLASLGYERSLLGLLAAWRRAFVSHYRFAIDGDEAAHGAWIAALPELERAMVEHEREFGRDRFLPALDLRELRRDLRDARWLERLRPAAFALAALDLALGLALLVLPGRIAGRRRARAAALALACALLVGGSTALFACGYRAAEVVFHVTLAVLVAWGAVALWFRIFRPAGVELDDERPSTLAVSLPLFAPLLLLHAALLGVFARRGPAPAYYVAVSALDEPWARAVLALAVAAVAAVGVAVGLRAAGGGRGGRASLARRALVLAGGLAVSLAAVAPLAVRDVDRTLPEVNDVLRLGPSIVGDAGTGVSELLSTSRLEAGERPAR